MFKPHFVLQLLQKPLMEDSVLVIIAWKIIQESDQSNAPWVRSRSYPIDYGFLTWQGNPFDRFLSPPPSPTPPVPSPFGSHALFGIAFHSSWKFSLHFWGPFLEGPENLPGPKSIFGDKCFSTEVNFYYLWMLNFKTFIILWIHWPRTMPVIGEKTFKNILIGAGKLSGISRNGHQGSVSRKSL